MRQNSVNRKLWVLMLLVPVLLGCLVGMPRIQASQTSRLEDSAQAQSIASDLTVFSEDCEGTFPGSWYRGDDNGNCGQDYWDTSTFRAAEGFHSAWCAQIGTQHDSGMSNSALHQYDLDMGDWMLRSVSLGSYASVELTYWYWLNSEPGYDYLEVMYFSEGSYHYVDKHTGDSEGWQQSSVSIPTTATWIGFCFTSDYMIHEYEGAYIDDILCTATAPTLALEHAKTWYWTSDTGISSVAVGDADGDGSAEVVTGGAYFDGTRDNAQLCVWSGSTLALEDVTTWYWTGDTGICHVAVEDIDSDGSVEIVTAGVYWDSMLLVAQLCVWSGSTLALEHVKVWQWTSSTYIRSMVVGDVDGDGSVEIVTGGWYYDNVRHNAQLCVWDGATLALEGVKTWYWTDDTEIFSVAVADVDGDGSAEIVTGGYYSDDVLHNAQLCVWSGSTLALENVKVWRWSTSTSIDSVAVGDVDGDGSAEIVTGGGYPEGGRQNAQLCVWSGSTLGLEHVTVWYWTDNTEIYSVVVGDSDGDAHSEIVTGGDYYDGTRYVAQFCVWDGSTLALELVTVWYWTNDTSIYSVAVGDVDADNAVEILTGGTHNDNTREVAQLTVWTSWVA